MFAMQQARVGSAHDFLLLTTEGREELSVVLHLDGLSASVQAAHYPTGFQDLADFFQGQADDWRGWTGVRLWESLEGDLAIESRHEYGHVHLRITLRKFRTDWGNDGWRVEGDLTIEPGEELTQVATDMQSLTQG